MATLRDGPFPPDFRRRRFRARSAEGDTLTVQPETVRSKRAESATVLQRAFEALGEFCVDALIYVPSTPGGARESFSAPKHTALIL